MLLFFKKQTKKFLYSTNSSFTTNSFFSGFSCLNLIDPGIECSLYVRSNLVSVPSGMYHSNDNNKDCIKNLLVRIKPLNLL